MDTTFEKIKGPQHCIIIVLLFGLTHTTSPSSLQLSAYGADLSSEACRELGFSSNLLCSSCDLLGEFSLSKLQPDCRQCCQQEAQMEARKLYAGAILEVFQGEFSNGIRFSCDTYFYVRGSDPVLKLLDDNGNIAEELSILKWNTDSVEEFLSEKLDRI
uniref:Selenoprotein F n=1 Tax=Echeneis naucrates TaxID=173247 RepID=A0A665UB37_ECHNA